MTEEAAPKSQQGVHIFQALLAIQASGKSLSQLTEADVKNISMVDIRLAEQQMGERQSGRFGMQPLRKQILSMRGTPYWGRLCDAMSRPTLPERLEGVCGIIYERTEARRRAAITEAAARGHYKRGWHR